MRAELYRLGAPEDVVAVATWAVGRLGIEAAGEPVGGLEHLLRPTSVVVEDASLLRPGTHGPSVLQPGSYGWFRAALLARAPELGLGVRFVATTVRGGWDPAARFQAFEEHVGRLASP